MAFFHHMKVWNPKIKLIADVLQGWVGFTLTLVSSRRAEGLRRILAWTAVI